MRLSNFAIKKCAECNEEYFCRKDKVETSRFCGRKCLSIFVRREQIQKDKSRTEEQYLDDLNRRMQKFIIKGDGCWGWTGVLKNRRKLHYGGIAYKGKSMSAHRASYMIHKGAIPAGSFVLHTCDNPPCTNPDHLYLGNALRNQRDKLERGRGKVEKLSIDQIKEIKRLLKLGENEKSRRNQYSGNKIAERFGVSRQTILSIKKGKTWTWL